MLGASRKKYVFAPYQIRKTFLGFPESVRIRFMDKLGQIQEINSVKVVTFRLQGMAQFTSCAVAGLWS